MYGCQNWQCSAGDTPEPTAKKYKKTTYKKITNDGVQVENLDPTGLRKILLYTYMTLGAPTKSSEDILIHVSHIEIFFQHQLLELQFGTNVV